MLKKLFLTFFFVLLFLFWAPQAVKAEACSEYNITPQEGPAGTVFTFTATECAPGHTYAVFMAMNADFDNAISGEDTVGDNGFVEISLQAVEPGNYYVQFGDFADPNTVLAEFNVTITDEPTDPLVFECGSIVPDGTPTCGDGVEINCCPVGCEWEYVQEPGTDDQVLSMCACGTAGRSCCPGGTCQYELLHDVVCNTDVGEYGICEPATHETVVRECGETVNEGEACVVECPATVREDGTQWCACGTAGGTCCGSGQACITPGYTCQNNVCLPPPVTVENPFSPYCTGGLTTYHTAFGCVDFSSPISVTLTFLGTGVRIVGGIALLMIAYSGLMTAVSMGDPRKLQNARSVLNSAIGGLLFATLSALILRVLGVDVLGIF